MTADRRSFLASSFYAAGTLAHGSRVTAPSVEARRTVFFGRPDSSLSLVRFFVSGIRAPAGRLRAFDTRRRLLGTAGLIATGPVLFGELWLPSRLKTIVTDVEVPNRRGPFRTRHRLRDAPRWTLYYASLVSPDELRRALAPLDPFATTVLLRVLARAGVALNPAPDRSAGSAAWDHISFLRSVIDVRNLERALGVLRGDVAMVRYPADLPLAQVLAGSGASRLIDSSSTDQRVRRIDVPGMSELLRTGVLGHASSPELDFESDFRTFQKNLERWFTAAPLAPDDDGTKGHALILDSRLPSSAGRIIDNIGNWNSRYSAPAIVTGDLSGFFRNRRLAGTKSPAPARIPEIRATSASAENLSRELERHRRNRAENCFTALAANRHGTEDSLTWVAANIDASVLGWVVFNPTPVNRTDIVKLQDRETLVTNVPPQGYVYLPDPYLALQRRSIPYSGPLRGRSFDIEIDPGTGAVSSLRHRESGSELAGNRGINGIDSEVAAVETIELQGIGTRLHIDRRLPDGRTFASTVTAYHRLPWVDIENHVPQEASILPFTFDLGQLEQVDAEVPLGASRIEREGDFRFLRWLSLKGAAGTTYLSCVDYPAANLRAGTIACYSPPGRSRFRIAFVQDPPARDHAWRFGWNSEPLLVRRSRPGGKLPGSGYTFSVDLPGAYVVDSKPADDGNGVIVFVHEKLGLGGTATLQSDLMTFENALLTDFTEKNGAPVDVSGGNRVSFRLDAGMVIAVRLCGIQLKQ